MRAAQTAAVRLHRVRLTVISGDPKTIDDSRKRTRNGGKRFRSELLFAPPEGGAAINSCGDTWKASPAPSAARLFAQK
jgi:hypothetical protein